LLTACCLDPNPTFSKFARASCSDLLLDANIENRIQSVEFPAERDSNMGYDSFKTAEANGVTIAYHETGSGEPLLLLHGGESNKGQYEGFVPFLSDGIHAISYDQRDTGDTVNPAQPYTLKELADDAVGLMDALGFEKAHVMGVSYGGMLTLQIGLHHPDRVQSLIVGAAPYSINAPRSPFAQRLVEMPLEERKKHMIDVVLSPKGQQNPDMMAALGRALEGSSTGPGSPRMAALAVHDMTEDAKKITAPTLLIYGGDDPVATPDNGEFLKARIPNSELVVLEGARHGLSFEFGEQTAKLLSDWVLSHPIGT
jgi:3-oxoadipate enol-lactonase